jgi:hypothetical protein
MCFILVLQVFLLCILSKLIYFGQNFVYDICFQVNMGAWKGYNGGRSRIELSMQH